MVYVWFYVVRMDEMRLWREKVKHLCKSYLRYPAIEEVIRLPI